MIEENAKVTLHSKAWWADLLDGFAEMIDLVNYSVCSTKNGRWQTTTHDRDPIDLESEETLGIYIFHHNQRPIAALYKNPTSIDSEQLFGNAAPLNPEFDCSKHHTKPGSVWCMKGNDEYRIR